MSTNNPETPTKRSPRTANPEDLASHIEAIRADLQNLTSTVGRVASLQMGRAQEMALDTARDAEDSIRRNPFTAVAIAAGLGFLLGVFTRR
ncbi:MAG TPA: hypothetical protein VGC99_12565 [Candidatus Tectomicrobia bacterium]|jgi:ElaB/YqjD/DUF883 family membrane-anchored ribosome-binding protein